MLRLIDYVMNELNVNKKVFLELPVVKAELCFHTGLSDLVSVEYQN